MSGVGGRGLLGGGGQARGKGMTGVMVMGVDGDGW